MRNSLPLVLERSSRKAILYQVNSQMKEYATFKAMGYRNQYLLGVVVLILTIIMCSISGAIATRRLQPADPADMF